MVTKKIKVLFAVLFLLLIVGISYSLDSTVSTNSSATITMTQDTFTFVEGDLIKIQPNTDDLDGDKVFLYYFSPLDKEGEWQTNLNDSGTYTTKIIASDGKSETEKEITLIVRNKNQKPKIDESDIVVWENETIDLTKLVSDLDGDDLTFTFEYPFDKDGIWTPGFDESGEYTTKFIASDLEFNEKGIIKITVKDKSSPPEFKFPEDKFVLMENETLTLDFNEYVFDKEDDKFSISIKSLPEGASLDNNVFEWNPGYDYVKRTKNVFTNFLNRLRIDDIFLSQQKTIKLDVSACDQKFCTNKTLKIKVENVNQKPSLVDFGDVIFLETEMVYLNVSAKDADGDYLTFSFSKPLNLKGRWKTKYGDQGNYLATIMVSDGKTSESKTVNITVKKKNRLPSLKIKEDYFKLNENQQLSFKVSATDPDNDDIKLSVKSLPDGASFKDGVFSWKPSYDVVTERKDGFWNNLYTHFSFLNRRLNKEYKQFSIDFVASDGEFDVTHPVLLTIKNVNRAPVSPSLNQVVATVGKPVKFSANITDFDGDELDYTWSFGLFDGSVKGVDSINRVFTSPGIKTIVVKASDGLSSSEQKWRVKVNPDPLALVKKVVEKKDVVSLSPVDEEEEVEEEEEVVVEEEPKIEPKVEPEPKVETKTIIKVVQQKCPNCPEQEECLDFKEVICPEQEECPELEKVTCPKQKCPDLQNFELQPEQLPAEPAEPPFVTYVIEW